MIIMIISAKLCKIVSRCCLFCVRVVDCVLLLVYFVLLVVYNVSGLFILGLDCLFCVGVVYFGVGLSILCNGCLFSVGVVYFSL